VSLLELNPDGHAALAEVDRDAIARRAPMPLRWLDRYPGDSLRPMPAAPFAKIAGRDDLGLLAAFPRQRPTTMSVFLSIQPAIRS
jgi:hypothetical protein